MSVLITIGVILLLALLALVAIAALQANAIVHHARFPVYNPPERFGITDYETVTLTTTDGIDLTAWYIAPSHNPGKAILYLHGISAARDQFLVEAKDFYDLGYGALLLDMRNHGDSGGSKTTMGVGELRDVQAAIAFLQSRPEVDSEHIGVMGNSLGGATALLAASQIPNIALVIAFSPYASFLQVVGDRARLDYKLPPRPTADLVLWFCNWLGGENFYDASPIAAMAHITPRPVLLIHGKLDPTTPYTNTELLKAAGGENVEIWLMDRAGHGDFAMIEPERFPQRIRTFFLNHLPPKS